MPQTQTLQTLALNLLSHREHSQFELLQKLKLKGFTKEEILAVLADLQARNWQSDERFSEQYIRYRAGRGYGPERIQNELKERGIKAEMISQMMAKCDINWLAEMAAVHKKKYQKIPEDFKLKLKQKQFLHYRGFGLELINIFFKQPEIYDE